MTKQEIIEACINKQLEHHGVTYDDVKKGGRYSTMVDCVIKEKKYLWGLFTRYYMEERKVPWYWYFTFESEQEFNEWKEFCINLFRKELKMSKKGAEKEFAWFNLNYGLKQNYEVKI